MENTTDKPLTKEAILAAKDIATQVVPVPEWGGSVTLKALSGKERDEFETFTFNRKDAKETKGYVADEIVAFGLSLAMIGPDGKRLFTPAEVTALNTKNGQVLRRLWLKVEQTNLLMGASLEAERKN
jgi:hypothetical protein